jgi:hypothetical protein
MCSSRPSPSMYMVLDRLPRVVGLGLSQRHNAHKGGPLTTGRGYGRPQRDKISDGIRRRKHKGHEKIGGKRVGRTPSAA